MRKLLFVCLIALFVPCCPEEGYGAPYSWFKANDTEWALLDLGRPMGSRQVGILEEDGTYTPLVNGEWGNPEEPPAMAGLPPGVTRDVLPTGVIGSKVQPNTILRRGKEITRDEAFELLGMPTPKVEGDKVPDDRSKIRVTVIGSPEKTAGPVAVAKKHSSFITQTYKPAMWAIQRQGFKTTVDPTIYIQAPDGKDLRVLEGYRGDEAFEKVLGQVERKIGPRPDYDKSKDQGWDQKPALPSLPQLDGVPWIPIAVVGSLFVVALLRRRVKVL